jgi:hypothetical protein
VPNTPKSLLDNAYETDPDPTPTNSGVTINETDPSVQEEIEGLKESSSEAQEQLDQRVVQGQNGDNTVDRPGNFRGTFLPT